MNTTLRRIKSTAALLASALAPALLLPAHPAAATEAVSVKSFHDFAPLYNDGGNGRADMILGSDGYLYGTTTTGGVQNSGVIFRISPTGKMSVIHSFSAPDDNGLNADGAAPQGSLITGDDGFLYGTTLQGGSFGNGTVFKISRVTGVYTVLHHFTGKNITGANADGAKPFAGLAMGYDGSLYGTASQGGSGAAGTIFKIAANGTFSDVYDFAPRDSSKHNASGATPVAPLLLGSDGYFYGTASTGGSNGTGTAFKVSTDGTFNTLHSFGALDGQSHNLDGATPSAKFVQGANGQFYGTAVSGGSSGNGVIFQMSTSGAVTPLFYFAALDANGKNQVGAAPYAGLILSYGGTFYGTAVSGGTNGNGVIYSLGADGKNFTVLHAFDAGDGLSTDGTNFDGAYPYAGLVKGGNSYLYGVAFGRGASLRGSVYQLDSDKKFSTIHEFQPEFNRGGTIPTGPLTAAADGKLYGTAAYGGPNGTGTIFTLAADGKLTVLHNFSAKDADQVNGDGGGPVGTLVPGADGSFYVATANGGVYDAGVAFKITPGGKMTILHQFGYGAENGGGQPFDGLIRGNDGNFYGTAAFGGTFGGGTVFRMTPSGTVTTLHHFTSTDSSNANTDGNQPSAALLLGSDGNFYGTTAYGGPNGTGTVFKITPTGNLTVLHHFAAQDNDGNSAEGDHPAAALIQGTDGNFYGVAGYGGSNGTGTLFVVTPGGDFAVLHTFAAFDGFDTKRNADGGYPSGSLLQGSDGFFYGTANDGGTAGKGTIFRVASLGGFTTLHSFAAEEGNNPIAALIQDGEGTFYGSTVYGGSGGTGNVFTMVLSPTITGDTAATATAGQPFSYQITATNGPTGYGVLGLPKGLTVNVRTGLISGTVTAAGKYTLTLKAVNRAGSDTRTLTLTVKQAPPVITSSPTASAKVGAPFQYQITASNEPTAYGVVGLPMGLTVNKATGLISGSPQGKGTRQLTLSAVNSVGKGTATLTVTITN